MKNILLKTRTAVLVFLTHKIALPVLKRSRKPNQFTYGWEQLQQLPAGSFGNDLFHFLEKRNLQLLNHYSRHDLKHVLLGYDTTDEGEACLQCFMLGNGRISFPVVATVVYSILTMPDHWKKMRTALQKGRKCESIHGWPWNELLPNKLQSSEIRSLTINH